MRAKQASGPAPELASQVRGLLLIRLLVTAVIGLLLIGASRAGTLGVSPGPLVALLVGVWALTLLYWAGMRSGISLGFLVGIQISLDLVFATILIAGTGGTSSPFVILYILTIFTAGTFHEWRGGLWAAMGSVFCFAVLGLAAASGVDARVPAGRIYYEIATYGSAFLIVAVLSGVLSKRSRQSREQLESATEELQRVMNSTDRIMECMPIGLMTASREGRILRTNHAARKILGIHADAEPEGQDIAELLGSLAPRLVEALESALAIRKWATREEIVLEKGSQECPIGVSVTPLIYDRETPEGVIVTFTDLREVRRMEREMMRSEQLAGLGELAAGVAHEIRNPLASISGAVQVMRTEVEPDGQDAELMDLIVRESDRLNRIIDGVLDYTRDHSRSREVHDVATTVQEVARLVVHDQELSMGKTTLVEFPADQSFRAEVEEGGMKQVFFNLTRNALEAMGMGGILRITGENPGDGRIHIVFRDTGVGIEPQELEHVFKPFHTSKKGGTGLGLSIASRIVEGNGGNILVKSTPGMGTAITVELPASSPDEGSSPAHSKPKKKNHDHTVEANR